MKAKQSNEMTAVKKKLMAAVAMLLVACIMTVSSTYAWFTLSTAPEVKGITTTVGANGNLEIALGQYDTVYGDGVVGSDEGDSMDIVGKDKHEANITWGNLIDLDYADYGLGEIKLYPSRLNATFVDGKGYLTSATSPLAFPEYGTDGRIVKLDENTMVGKFDPTSGGFKALETPNYAGVNGIGSASDMTDRQFAARNNKNAIETNRLAAQNEAKGAISLYSGDLAALALDNMADDPDAVIAAEDVATLNALLTKLEKSADAIHESLKASVMLVLAAQPQDKLSDQAWADTVASLSGKDINGMISTFSTLTDVSLPSVVTDIVTKYNTIAGNIGDAQDVLTAAAADSTYTWGEVKDAVNALLVANKILICGETISDIKATKDSDDPDSAFKKVAKEAMNGGLVFQFDTGSGVFADIADLVGAYTATIEFPEGLEVEGIPIGGLKKPVTVKSGNLVDATLGDLGVAYKDVLSSMNAPGAAAGAAKALTDTYGYSIDLIFRTNATDSYLNLQTAAANRIYETNNNEMLMGGGSNMSFTVGGEYTKSKIDGLAAGIRVVFYDTTSTNHEILGVAILDTASGNVSGDQYKLDLKLVDYTIGANGKMDVSAGFITTDKAETAMDERVGLTALSANVPKAISALVYLDGDVVDNGDAGVAALLNGKLNLQFASSASLTPMDNNTLMNAVPENN